MNLELQCKVSGSCMSPLQTFSSQISTSKKYISTGHRDSLFGAVLNLMVNSRKLLN